MQSTPTSPQPPDQGLRPWFGFWIQFVVLALLAILGLHIASDGAPGDYATGLLLTVGAILLAFLRLKAHFDGVGDDWTSFLFVDRPGQLVVVIPLFTVIALGGLFMGAGAPGSLQGAGVALFIVSGLVIFLSLKRVFDRLDSGS
ncbi:MAG TPA: hypothetical protein VME45_16795 [Stellaceae bacterium]|nr:hypothetical protein [Stellaceae bacterium]